LVRKKFSFLANSSQQDIAIGRGRVYGACTDKGVAHMTITRIPLPVRYAARSCYQLMLMRGIARKYGKRYSAEVSVDRNSVFVGNYKGDFWEVPISDAWINL
jgi:hypothetical protein